MNLVNRYQSNHIPTYCETVKRSLNHLKVTIHYKLVYQADMLEVVGYSNADFRGDKDDGKSASGHFSIFGGATVS